MLKKLRHKLSQSVDDMEDERLRTRCQDLGTVDISTAPLRVPVRVGGEIQGLQVVPRAGSASLEVTLGDGTGRAVAVFTGRRRLSGLDPGRTVVIEGVGRSERGRVVLVNPSYTVLP